MLFQDVGDLPAVEAGPVPDVIAGLCAIAALAFAVVWWHFLGRKRLIQDLPTSKAKGVALGLNEVIGTAGEANEEVLSPQTSTDCVWWKNEFYLRDDKNGSWKKNKEQVGGALWFSLVDESGSILVRPRKAEVQAPKVYDGPDTDRGVPAGRDPSLVTRYLATRNQKERRVVEHVIRVGDPVYVLGTAQLPLESLEPYIGPDRVDKEPFLIRVGDESDALFVERVAVAVGAAGAIAATAAAGIAYADGDAIYAGGFDWSTLNWQIPLAFLGVLTVAACLASLVHIYNGLIRLHQRAEAAWGLIDVQLRRRHDLIPKLVETVKAHTAHEQSVMTSVTQLRSSLAPDLPEDPSDAGVREADAAMRGESIALARLVALAESYPALKANALFQQLSAELVDTEDRVALARSFYNNSVQVLHDRAHVFPGALVAWVFELDLKAEFLADLGGAAVPRVAAADKSPVIGNAATQPTAAPLRHAKSWFGPETAPPS